MKEFWRPICGYEQHYEVSNFSKIRNLHTGLILKQSLKDGKYLCVCLHYNKPKVIYVHKIVADAFPEVCGVYFDGAQVDHINTNKKNNFFLNLKYKTAIENRHNPLTEKHCKNNRQKNIYAKASRKIVYEVDRNSIIIKTWRCSKDIAEHYNVNKSTVCRWIKNKKVIDNHIFCFNK